MQKKIKRRLFLTAGVSVLGVAASGCGASVYSYDIEPAWIEINTLSLHLSRLDPHFDNYRIVQLSDIHSDLMWMDKPRLEHIVQLVNDQQPDIVAITGDFISGIVNDKKLAALTPLRSLRARDGVFAVLGNHDHWAEPWGEPVRIRRLLQDCGIHELNDRVHTLQRAGSMLHFVGLDDLWPDSDYIPPIWSHRDRLTRIVEGLPSAGTVILLVHEPDFADIAASVGRVDLQLSGHTHGGQVRIPFYGALRLPPLGQRYPSGLYRSGSMLHYTNRGVGMVSPLVRFNCRPEITVFACHPA